MSRFKTHCAIYRKDALKSAVYLLSHNVPFYGDLQEKSVPGRVALLSIWVILSLRTVNYINDQVSLFELTARKLRAKCKPHL